MSVAELSEDFEDDFQTEKRVIKAKEMPTYGDTRDMIVSALNKLILSKLAENESLDINLVREAVIKSFNEAMSPNYTVKSVLQSNGTITLFVEGYESFDLEKLKDLADSR